MVVHMNPLHLLSSLLISGPDMIFPHS
jgi:hypothetical protein